VREDWDFQVKQISNREFRAAFPDQSSIDTFAKLTEIQLALYGFKVKIKKTNVDPTASSVLQTAWVKLFGIPDFAKEEDIVKEIASLVGEPIKVDEFSLLRDEPVRVRVNCRDPAQLRGYVEIFFNGVGYEIRFVAEGLHGRNHNKGDGPPGSGRKEDKREKDGSSDKGGAKNGNAGGGPSNNHKHNDNELEGSQGESQDESMEDLVHDGSPEDNCEKDVVEPIAAYHPTLGVVSLAGNTTKIQGQDHALGQHMGEAEVLKGPQLAKQICKSQKEPTIALSGAVNLTPVLMRLGGRGLFPQDRSWCIIRMALT
jgi:hypothetical protein